MTWSPSAHRAFERCPRQWFFKHKMADIRATTDPARVEAAWLGKLKSVEAWRGLVVDHSIQNHVVPVLNRKQVLNEKQAVSYALNVFDKQYQAMRAGQWRHIGIGLLPLEDGRGVDQEQIDQARSEVEAAMRNFLVDQDLLTELYNSDYLVTQRTLTIPINGVSARGIPDLIAFSREKPPIIYDWKVHFFGTFGSEDQLMFYAFALARCTPHKDFVSYMGNHSLYDYRLREVQLIAHQSGYQRQYTVTPEKVEALEDRISSSLLRMRLTDAHLPYKDIRIGDFETGYDASHCPKCSFHSLCKQVKS